MNLRRQLLIILPPSLSFIFTLASIYNHVPKLYSCTQAFIITFLSVSIIHMHSRIVFYRHTNRMKWKTNLLKIYNIWSNATTRFAKFTHKLETLITNKIDIYIYTYIACSAFKCLSIILYNSNSDPIRGNRKHLIDGLTHHSTKTPHTPHSLALFTFQQHTQTLEIHPKNIQHQLFASN